MSVNLRGLNIGSSHSVFLLSALFLLLISCRSTSEVATEPADEPATTQESTESTTETLSPQDSLEAAREELLLEMYKDELHSDFQAKANRITNFYILAQQQFYLAEYETALDYINRAIAIQEHPYVLAMRGSINLGLGRRQSFVDDWRRALEMDENVPIPQSDYIISALQSYGLIDENLRKNF
jgi:tetratricopeptide (TPR) repeat protein